MMSEKKISQLKKDSVSGYASTSNVTPSSLDSNKDTIGLMVHSYNNYLSGLMGFTELALLECEQPEVRERLELGLDSGNEAVVFGKELLASIGRLQVKLENILLVSLFNDFNSQCRHVKISESALKLVELIEVKTSSEWFVRGLLELVNFCVDYASQQSMDKTDKIVVNVKIDIELLPHTIKLIFKTPLKLDSSQQTQLFDAFYSSRQLLGKKHVGLAMVKGFLAQMQSSIEWQNDVGFIIKLPSPTDNIE